MKNNNIQENLKHQGWQQLGVILDKEMPVKKNKKRLIIFWGAFLLISTIAIIGFIKVNKNEVALKVSSTINQNDDKNNNKEQILTEKNIISNIKSSINAIPIVNKQKKRKLENHFAKQFHQSDSNLVKTHDTQNTIINTAKIIDVQTTPEDFSLLKIKKVATSKKSTFQNISTSKINNFKPIDVWKNTNETKFNFNKNIISLNEKKKRIFNPFIQIETYVYNDKISTKPKFNFKIGNKFSLNNRLSLNFDIGLIQSELITDNVLEYISPPLDIELNGYTEKDIIEYKRLLIDVKESRYNIINSSLNIEYDLNIKLNFLIGGGIVYTKMVKYSIESKYDSRLINSEISKAYISYKKSINDFTYFSNVGFSYSVFDELDLSIGYKLYFKYLSNKSNFNKHHLFLGVSYSLFK
jgi:hypothetical protein